MPQITPRPTRTVAARVAGVAESRTTPVSETAAKADDVAMVEAAAVAAMIPSFLLIFFSPLFMGVIALL